MPTTIAVGLALVVCAILGGAATVQWQQRQSQIAETAQASQNLAGAIEAQVRGNIDAVDIALAGLARALPLLPAAQRRGDDDIHALLRADVAGLSFVRALRVTNAAGDVVHDTDRLPDSYSFATRAYFAAQRDNPALGLYLGAPIADAKGVWFVSASRRINRPDGSFAGVVVAALDPLKFEAFFATVKLGETGTVALLSYDSLLIARAPAVPALVGKAVLSAEQQRVVLGNANPGTLRVVTPVDGLTRIVAYRRLPDRPLVVVVGLGLTEALAPWRASSLALGAAALALSALIAALAYLVWRELSRTRALNLGLQQARLKADGTAHELAAVLDAIPDLMFEMDLDGRIHAYRTQRHDLLSAPPEVFLGKLMAEVLPPEATAICLAALQQAHAQGFSTGMQYELMIGPERKWFEASVARKRVAAGQAPRFVFLSRDITARRLAEAALRESEERFRGLTNLAAHWYWEQDENLRFRNFTGGVEPRTSTALQSHIGKTRWELPALNLSEDDWSQHRAMLARHENFYEFEMRRPDVDGRMNWVAISGKANFDAAGRFGGYSGFGRDITQRKAAEQALESANRELARSNAELEQFAYIASHDLQEPLRAVSSCVQLLQKRYQGQLDARADEFIAHAVGGSVRMQALIDDVLVLSRVNTGARSLTATDSATALEVARTNLQVAIAESSAQITHDALPLVQADPGQMAQLLQNLIGNALKFCGDKPAVVHVGVRREAGEWLFSVADQGIGIEPQYFSRIFELFKRLHTRDEYAGTGIGLAICKKIVERHGGRIWVESERGQGTTFYFTLPLHAL